jgi:hypothetical protein
VAHLEETPKYKVPNLEDYAILEDFEDVFKKVPKLPPRRDIDFYINFMPGAEPVSKCVTLGCPSLVCEKEGWKTKVVH